MKTNKKPVSELTNETRKDFFPLKYKEQDEIFSKVFPPGSGHKLSKKESAGLIYYWNEYRKLNSEKFLIKNKGKVVEWVQGEMDDFETFYMRNTGILPTHQNKGVYKEFFICL